MDSLFWWWNQSDVLRMSVDESVSLFTRLFIRMALYIAWPLTLLCLLLERESDISRPRDLWPAEHWRLQLRFSLKWKICEEFSVGYRDSFISLSLSLYLSLWLIWGQFLLVVISDGTWYSDVSLSQNQYSVGFFILSGFDWIVNVVVWYYWFIIISPPTWSWLHQQERRSHLTIFNNVNQTHN